MKSELFTAIGVAIAGVVIAFIATNLIVGNWYPIEEIKVKSLDGEITTELAEPNPLVFNYRAINPTVEVYVGNEGGNTPGCNATDDAGNCIDVDVNNQENQ